MPSFSKVKGFLKLGYRTFNNSRSLKILNEDEGEGKMVVLLDSKGEDSVMPIEEFANAAGGGDEVAALRERIKAIEKRLDEDAIERTR